MRPLVLLLCLGALIAAAPARMAAQGVITFGGSVPAFCWMTDQNNASLAGVLGDFTTLTVGKGTVNTPTPLAIRLRSNAPYVLLVQMTSVTGIADAVATVAGTTAQAMKTGDIGFGITGVDVSLSRLVGGGTTPIRQDVVASGFDVRVGWPLARNGHTPAFAKTLHDIYLHDVQILSGPRISADGDNYSNNNYMTVRVGIASVPQFLTPASFSGLVTFTVLPSGT